MSDISTALIEFSEHKRLLFERIRHKFGAYIDEHGNHMGPYIGLSNDILSDLYIESAETIELHIYFNDLKIDDDKTKMKWMGLYTTALAKETHARQIWVDTLMSGSSGNELSYIEYKNLLSESEKEKDKLINLLKTKKV